MKNKLRQIKENREKYRKLKEEELREKTKQLKERAKQESLEELMVEAYSNVWEGAARVLKLEAYDVQLMGAMVLNKGQIAEMKTGEGKSLVAAFASYLNALSGKGVHIVTVNDYLAKRDERWIGEVLRYLGLKTAVITNESSREERKKGYEADVTYITNSELGFDYLRDHMAWSKEEIVQREFNYCIIDEVDSILIDEARTPLIISGPTKGSEKPYKVAWEIGKRMKEGEDYELEEKSKQVILKEKGIRRCEEALEVKDIFSMETPWAHYVMNAIKAKHFYIKDVNYIIKEGEVVIVDEFTGRIMGGRRWADGLHQAIEAKEGVKIQEESETLASITYQNLFLLYPKLAGMTGTAKTEEEEFEQIYGLKVVSIPTHRKMKRKDYPDVVYRTNRSKWMAVAEECERMWTKGRPVLVGTTSIEKSELLARLLEEKGVKYKLLNARPSLAADEASIIAQTGKIGSITIATNMAGRGTDIILGGNIKEAFGEWIKERKKQVDIEEEWRKVLEGKADEESEKKYKQLKEEHEKEQKRVKQLGGLYVIGTERHESRRIDNQLRGRSGRQGDEGSSRFFISLEDDLLRIFGGGQMGEMMSRLGVEEPLESAFLSKSLDRAQKKVENYYYQMRKQLFEYDQVLNSQRKAIYKERTDILRSEEVGEWSKSYIRKEWPGGLLGIKRGMRNRSEVEISYDVKKMQMESVQAGLMNELERLLLLQQIDKSWSKHLKEMSLLREFIAWRGYAQRDPLVEYKNESYNLFIKMIEEIRQGYAYSLFRSQA
jgi:preprotein translocase subunit SecA